MPSEVASTVGLPADAMRSAAESSSPARTCSITLRQKGKDRAGSGGDGIAELVTDAELVREGPRRVSAPWIPTSRMIGGT